MEGAEKILDPKKKTPLVEATVAEKQIWWESCENLQKNLTYL